MVIVCRVEVLEVLRMNLILKNKLDNLKDLIRMEYFPNNFSMFQNYMGQYWTSLGGDIDSIKNCCMSLGCTFFINKVQPGVHYLNLLKYCLSICIMSMTNYLCRLGLIDFKLWSGFCIRALV